MKPIDISKKGKGALIKTPSLRDYRLESVPCAIVLPKSFSLKDKVGKIKNQNGSGSCVSQACSYYAEVLNTIETGEKKSLSPRFLYPFCFIEPMGSYIKDNMSYIKGNGIATEASLTSYENGNPPSEKFMRKKDDITEAIRQEAMTYWIKDYYTWNNTRLDLFKQAIVQGNGCVVASWGNNEVWKTGDIELPSYRNQMNWQHGIYLIGYNDDKKAFEFVNSWGKEWGYEGFGWLPYSYVEQGYVSNPYTMIDVKNQTYSFMMALISAYKNLISILKK